MVGRCPTFDTGPCVGIGGSVLWSVSARGLGAAMQEHFQPVDDGVLRAVDRQLVGHGEFGDSGLIRRRVTARYEFAVGVLGEWLPGVGAAFAAGGVPAPVVRDPVVRSALEDALLRLERGPLSSPDEVEEVLAAALALGRGEGDGRVPTQVEEGGGLRTGPGGAIWLAGLPPEPGVLGRRFERALIEQFLVYYELTGRPRRGEERFAALIDVGCDLLVELLPQVGRSALAHIAAVGLVGAAGGQGRLLSAAGGDRLPSTIALEAGQLADAWQVAGRLLHEGLHLKVFDVARTFALLADPGVRIAVPWRTVAWDLRRVLVSFHVYVHMVLFDAAVQAFGGQLSSRFGAPERGAAVSRGVAGAGQYAGAVQRAGYLAGQLTGPLARHLTADGRRMVGWLMAAVEPLFTPGLPASVADTGGGEEGAGVAPAGGYRRVPEVRLRAEPDLGCLFAFVPHQRRLHSLNLAAWAVFELCDGRARTELERSYQQLLTGRVPAADAARQARQALVALERIGLITAT
jgi:hypothetical protein